MNSLWVRLAGLLGLGLVLTIGGALVLQAQKAEMSSLLRREAAEQSQLADYLRLSARMNELYRAQAMIAAGGLDAGSLDFLALREQVGGLVLSIQAAIERADGPADGQRDELVSIAARFDTAVAHLEQAEAMYLGGLAVEAQAFLSGVFDQEIHKDLEPLILAAIERERAATSDDVSALTRLLDRFGLSSLVFFAALAAVLIGTAVLVLRPLQIGSLRMEGLLRSLMSGEPEAAALSLPTEFRRLQGAAAPLGGQIHQLRRENAVLRRHLEIRVEGLQDEQATLRDLDQARRDFLADTSHELRTPLTVIRGLAEVALGGHRPSLDEMQAALTRIVKEVGHVSRIVDDLFFIARSQAGTVDLRTDQFSLIELAEDLRAEAKGIIETKGGKLFWQGPAGSVELEGDRGRLRQLITILVENAVKYGSGHAVVELSVTCRAGGIDISVRDHGPGIPESDLPKVFQRFYRSPETAETRSGTGLGLSLAASIAEGHGGRIEAANAPGGGAVFTVMLPVLDLEALEEGI